MRTGGKGGIKMGNFLRMSFMDDPFVKYKSRKFISVTQSLVRQTSLFKSTMARMFSLFQYQVRICGVVKMRRGHDATTGNR